MPTPRVIIELSPSRIEIATMRGATLGEWRCERVSRAEWPSPYTTSLPEAAGTIKRLLGEMGVLNARATIIYNAPGSVTGLTSCANSINAAGAEQAATLALTNVADFPTEDAPSDTCTLFNDRAHKKVKGAAAPDALAQRHILACADSEDRAAALCEAIGSHGLHIEGLIPAEAVATADAIRRSTSSASPDEIAAVAWIGEHSTSLAVGCPGRLHFARTISAGTEALADVLCRPLRARDPDAVPVQLDHQAARSLLLTVGVPAPDAIIPGPPTLAGSALLPHLQPILQRLSTEIKQSLRFGVSEADRVRIRLHLAGPGAAVPGLGEAIAKLSGFRFDPIDVAIGAPDALDSSTGGLIHALANCPTLSICILPVAARQARKLRAARKALLIGAALAMTYIGYETFDAYSTLRGERAKLTSATSALQSSQGPMAVRQGAITARAALTDAEHRLRKAMEQTPDWAAMMEVVSQTTPEPIRLSTLDMVRDGSRCTIDLRGHIRFGEVRDPSVMIRSYVEALEAIPAIETIRLGAISRAALAGHDSQTFDLTLSVVQLPAAPGLKTAAALHPEGK